MAVAACMPRRERTFFRMKFIFPDCLFVRYSRAASSAAAVLTVKIPIRERTRYTTTQRLRLSIRLHSKHHDLSPNTQVGGGRYYIRLVGESRKRGSARRARGVVKLCGSYERLTTKRPNASFVYCYGPSRIPVQPIVRVVAEWASLDVPTMSPRPRSVSPRCPSRHPAATAQSRGQGASFKGSQVSRDGH